MCYNLSMAILWNRVPTEEFCLIRGTRQGDPLTPYIFVVCIERLAHLIEDAIFMNQWKPIQVSRGGPQMSNLLLPLTL